MQEKAIRAKFIPELFVGGSRGPGKTSFLLGDYATDVQEYGTAWRGIIFRRTYPELDEVVEEGKKVLYKAFPGTDYKVGVHEFRIPHSTGMITLRLRHIENEGDADHYQGHSYTWVAFDELPNWSNLKHYHKLKATLRSTAGVKNLRYRATGNPGGPGHMSVKEYFIDAGPPETVIEDDQSQMPRMWIPGKVWENKILLDNDPQYIDRLKSVGDPELVRAWLEGDWTVLLGAFFNSFKASHSMIPSFEIPDGWPLFGGLDYGEASPTAFGLFTADYDYNVYMIGEYYAAGRAASQHAYEIDKMISSCPFTNGRRPSQIFADPSMWVKRRLTEVVSHSPYDIFREQGLYLSKANNDRITGWRVINDSLARDKLWFFRGWCDNFIEELTSVPRSTANPEDVDTKSRDHAVDALRYFMMHVYKPAQPTQGRNRNPFLGDNVLTSMDKR